MKPLKVEIYKVYCSFRTVAQEYLPRYYAYTRVKLNSLVANKLRANKAL